MAKSAESNLFGVGCICGRIDVRKEAHSDEMTPTRLPRAGCPVHAERFRPGEESSAMELGMRALERSAARNVETIEKLIALADEIARKAGEYGVTTSDLRVYAVQRGILTGSERGKALSYLGTVMRRAGLVNTGQARRSPLPSTHAIRQTVWVHSTFSEGKTT